MASPLFQSSLPVCASSAYSTALVEFLMRYSERLYARPMSYAAWSVSSPLPYANTTPLAITGGSARSISREIQAGVSVYLPALSSTLKATTAPFLTAPFSTGAVNLECFGPQKGDNTQRVPLASSQLASEPHTPAEAKLTSSLQ